MIQSVCMYTFFILFKKQTLFIDRMKYEWVCKHVIVLDVCYTIKRPTMMCLAKKKSTHTKKIGCLPLCLRRTSSHVHQLRQPSCQGMFPGKQCRFHHPPWWDAANWGLLTRSAANQVNYGRSVWKWVNYVRNVTKMHKSWVKSVSF